MEMSFQQVTFDLLSKKQLRTCSTTRPSARTGCKLLMLADRSCELFKVELGRRLRIQLRLDRYPFITKRMFSMNGAPLFGTMMKLILSLKNLTLKKWRCARRATRMSLTSRCMKCICGALVAPRSSDYVKRCLRKTKDVDSRSCTIKRKRLSVISWWKNRWGHSKAWARWIWTSKIWSLCETSKGKWLLTSKQSTRGTC